MAADPLASFTPQVKEWFGRAFAEPTEAQHQAWPAIAGGEHVIVSAPTGSGKTLAAFLWGLDRLVAEPAAERRTRLVYVSPLKALSYDVEKNLRAPLKGIGGDITVGIRTGDTPQKERQAMLRNPPDVLITTPESLYLMLTSRAREILAGRRVVHRRRDPRGGAHQARRPPGPHARAPRPRLRARGAANRPVGHAASAGGGRALPRGHRARLQGGGHGRAQAAGPGDPGAGRRHARAGRPRRAGSRGGGHRHLGGRRRPGGRRPRRARGVRRHPALDLARDLPRAAGAGAGAPLDDRVREQPPRRRAAGGAPERAGGRGGKAR